MPLTQEGHDALIDRKVLKALTTKNKCMQCGRSVTLLYGEDPSACERCDNTSFHTPDGRPWGPKHRYWDDFVRREYNLTEDDRITEETFDMVPEEYINDYFVLGPASAAPVGEKGEQG